MIAPIVIEYNQIYIDLYVLKKDINLEDISMKIDEDIFKKLGNDEYVLRAGEIKFFKNMASMADTKLSLTSYKITSMRHMRYIIILFLFVGCSTKYYHTLPDEWKELIKRTENLGDLDRQYIYSINGKQLKDELPKYKKTMVVVFSNVCSSKYCLPLSFYEKYAIENQYKLFLVMTSLNYLDKSYNQFFYTPLLVIDEFYYKHAWQILNHFEKDLLGENVSDKNGKYLGDIYFFENGNLKQIVRELPK